MHFTKFSCVIFLFFTLGLICPTIVSEAKPDTLDRKNAINLELAGPAGYWAVGYERIIKTKNRWRMFGAVAASMWGLEDYNGDFNPNFSIPIIIGGLYGGRVHNLELALSNTIFSIVAAESGFQGGREFGVNGNVHTGYRYSAPHDRWYIKIYYLGALVRYKYFVNYGGLGIGYSF